MFHVPPPLPPEPFRGSFATQEEYDKAMRAHRKMKAQDAEVRKDTFALAIVAMACYAIMGAVLIGALGFVVGGWRGVIGAYLLIGLFVAAVSRVRMML